MKILLQHKTFVGYILLIAIIGSMVAIVLHSKRYIFLRISVLMLAFQDLKCRKRSD